MPEDQPTELQAGLPMQTNGQVKCPACPPTRQDRLEKATYSTTKDSRPVQAQSFQQLSRQAPPAARNKPDRMRTLSAARRQEIEKRVSQIHRMALDAPHWFGVREQDVRGEEEALLTKRYGIQIEERGYEQAVPSVLLFPAVGADAEMAPHSRTQQLLQFRPVLNRCAIGVFSLVGGVGATSIAAGMARLLATCGERVMLADAGGHTLLPRYFGGKGSRQGAVRKFDPMSGSVKQSVRTVSLDVESYIGCDEEMDRILKEFCCEASRVDRVIWDLGNAPADWVARVLQPGIRVLVPLLPTAKCLMQLASTEELLRRIQNSGCTAQWQYILNQFDERDPSQVEIRARFRAQLGGRLLPFILRPSPLVNEALLCGRNIVDHAPACPLVADLWRLTRSVTGMAAPYPTIAPEAWGEA